MTALIVIGCILLFFVFILSLKAKITVVYDGEVALYLKVLFIKIKIKEKNMFSKIDFSKLSNFTPTNYSNIIDKKRIFQEIDIELSRAFGIESQNIVIITGNREAKQLPSYNTRGLYDPKTNTIYLKAFYVN
jgi:hypothetical protein